jgi:DNA repair photolyase
MEHRRVEDFSRKIYVKVDAPAVLREQLKPGMLRAKPVAIGTATDPYQPAERRFEITRRILHVLADQPDLDLSITTKSPLILRDLDLLKQIARHRPLNINISLITTSPRLSRLLEPGAPSPLRRLRVIRRLARAGLHVNLLVMPILPDITDGLREMEALLKAARDRGAVGAYENVLHLRGADRRSFWPILRKHFPHLLRLYDAFYRNSVYAPKNYRDTITGRFNELKERLGYPKSVPERVYLPLPGDQAEIDFCAGESGQSIAV